MAQRILYVQYTNPAGYPPLEHSSRIFANHGWQVLFLGTGTHGTDVLEFPPHPNIEVRKWRFQPAGVLQKLHYIGFCLWCVWTATTWRPKWIYASDALSCPIALLLKKLGFRVLYHEHDAPEGENAEKLKTEKLKLRAFQKFLLWARKRVACSAAVCVIPNEKRIERFKETTGRTGPTFCVWNCPMREEAEPEPKKATDEVIIFYHGSLVPSRFPLTVIDALATLPGNVVLEFAGYETVGHAGFVSELLSRAEFNGVSDRVRYHGPVPHRNTLLELCRRAHVGLALMPLNGNDPNEQTMTGASNKPFDYLACGLALVVSNLPDWNAIFVRPGYGRACDPRDATSISTALRWFIEHPVETKTMGEQGRQRAANDWNYEVQFQLVLECLESN